MPMCSQRDKPEIATPHLTYIPLYRHSCVSRRRRSISSKSRGQSDQEPSPSSPRASRPTTEAIFSAAMIMIIFARRTSRICDYPHSTAAAAAQAWSCCKSTKYAENVKITLEFSARLVACPPSPSSSTNVDGPSGEQAPRVCYFSHRY